MLPRRYREEVLAHVAHGAPVVLAGRYRGISTEEKVSALGLAWAAALHENPQISRISIARARLERFAKDLGEDHKRAMSAVDGALRDALALIKQSKPSGAKGQRGKGAKGRSGFSAPGT
jgi:hypothetical protein